MTIFDNVEGKKDDERNWPFELNITNRKGAGQLLCNQRADGAKIHPLNVDNVAQIVDNVQQYDAWRGHMRGFNPKQL